MVNRRLRGGAKGIMRKHLVRVERSVELPPDNIPAYPEIQRIPGRFGIRITLTNIKPTGTQKTTNDRGTKRNSTKRNVTSFWVFFKSVKLLCLVRVRGLALRGIERAFRMNVSHQCQYFGEADAGHNRGTFQRIIGRIQFSFLKR
jgi:hypothetical protein